MTNENRIKIYKDTITCIREKYDISRYEVAIYFEEDYRFTIPKTRFSINIVVADNDTFEAIRQHDLEDKRVCVLNFANAYIPGGGVLKGYSAQEEELCRRSSLHLSLTSETVKKYYDNNRKYRNLFNDNSLILSHNVIVVKNTKYEMLQEVINTAVVTMSAPNMLSEQAESLKKDLFMLLKKDIDESDFLKEIKVRCDLVIEEKIERIRGCMLENGYIDIVLGAWGGAGAFGHNVYNIAKMFRKVINNKFDGCFRTIVFAVLDNTEEKVKVKAFKDAFING